MADEQEMRDQIIDAATRMFRKWGLKKTTMEDIASEAGKGKATLYYYFKSKEEVFSSVITKQLSEMRNVVRQQLNTAETASEKLKIHFSTMFLEARKRITIFNMLKIDVKEDKKLLYNLREEIDDLDLKFIREIMEYGSKRGEFRKFEAAELASIAYIISSALRSVVINLLVEQDLPDETERIETISEFLVRGLLR